MNLWEISDEIDKRYYELSWIDRTQEQDVELQNIKKIRNMLINYRQK